MGGPRLVVVADDFGKSSSVNRAIAEAHEKGIVTAASIMPGGEAFEEAVRISRSSRSLSVGLHLTLCDGNAVLPRSSIPDLVDETGCFEKSPSLAWIRYSRSGLLKQLDKEIEAQFDRVKKAGIQPSHVDSHHHIHMQPSVFSLLCRHASRHGVEWVRVPAEPVSLIFACTRRGVLPLIEWAVFGILGFSHKKKMRQRGLQTADCVYGLSRTGHLDEAYLLKMAGALKGAGSDGGHPRDNVQVMEIFSHPDSGTAAGRRELHALTSSLVRDRMTVYGMTLAGYRELSGGIVQNPAGERS